MKYLFFILNIFFISSINAEEAIHKDINLNIPTPKEMVKISQDMGDIYYDFKKYYDQNNISYYFGIYVVPSDLKERSSNLRKCEAHTPKNALNINITPEFFLELKSNIENKIIKHNLKDKNKEKDQYGRDNFSMEENEIILNTDKSLVIRVLSSYTMVENKIPYRYIENSISSINFVNNKYITLTCSGHMLDTKILKEIVLDWTKRLHSENL